MKNLYSFLRLAVLFLFSATVSAQVLIPENFEGETFPAGWTQASSPAVSITTVSPCEGSRSALMPISSSNTQARLRSAIQTTTGSAIEVSFEYKIINQTGGGATPANFGSLYLQYTTNANDVNTVWTTYATIDNTNHTPSTNCTNHTATIPASSLPTGSDFAWRIVTDWAVGTYNVYIDDFIAAEQVPCIEPIYIEVDDVTFDEADISWIDLNGATQWEIEYASYFFPNPGMGQSEHLITTTTNPTTLTNLNDGTEYTFYIRAVCSPTDQSNWAGPFSFQTIAIGTDCATPIQVTTLPYTHSADTQTYGDSYSGSPGNGCVGTNYLEGNEVVYKYTPATDDYLKVKVSNLVGEDRVGIFMYEACADIGNNCYEGGTTSTGTDIDFDVFVGGGQDYYFVLSTAGANTTTEYTLDITGFDCASFGPPNGQPTYEFFGQTLGDFDNRPGKVKPTYDDAFAHLVWYQDNGGVPGAVIPNTSAISLTHNSVYHVNQVLGTCESAFLMVTFTEFDCLGQLAILTTDSGAEICDEGTTTLSATAATNNLFWYDTEFGGEVRGTGNSFETDVITQTTSYWVAEAFIGEGNLTGQANPGPSTISTATTNNGVLIENISSDFTLIDVQVFSTGGGGTTTVTLIDESGGTADQVASVSLPSGSSAVPTPYTIPLGFELESGKSYRLLKTTGPSMIYSTAATSTFPYNVGTVAQVTNGATGSGTTTAYYYFYNWTISEEQPLCESPRTEVIATVNEVYNIVPSATTVNVCVGQPADLTATSTDTDYIYTWTWNDPSGMPQTMTGANIQPIIVQNTTFNVTGYNPITGCTSPEESITINAIGAGAISITPEEIDVCVGDIVELRAGGIYNTFEETPTNWTVTNSSTGTNNPAAAGWKLVNSPYNPTEGATSNDNSQFYIATAEMVGPTGNVNTQLTSPSFNLVGVQNATLSFYHYYKHSLVQNTQAKVQVSVGNGPWTDLHNYGSSGTNCFTCNVGTPTEFEHETINLSSYTGAADVRIRFDYTGKWGWWWAIDNVTIERSYTNGQVTWASTSDLFMDEFATVPYTGSSTNTVYFKSNSPGTFTYNVALDIIGCAQPVTNSVVITVSETLPPTGPAVQDYMTGQTLSSLDVTGQDLRYYILVDGEYIQISPNHLLQHGVTYYITQTMNGCESDYLEVTVNLDCPAPTDVAAITDVGTTGTHAAVLITWTPPASILSIQNYYIEITDSSGATIFQGTAAANVDYRIIQGLAFEEEFELEIYAVCDAQIPVYSSGETIIFNTFGLGTEEMDFDGFTYYPNPTSNVVTFSNTAPIKNIEVFSMAGQKVLDMKNIDNNEVVVDFEAFPTGVYFSLVTVGDSVQVIRIIRE